MTAVGWHRVSASTTSSMSEESYSENSEGKKCKLNLSWVEALGELFGGEAKLSVLDSFKWGYILQYNSKILIYHIGLFYLQFHSCKK